MTTREQLIRHLLNEVAQNGAYTERHLINMMNLYDEGYAEAKQEVRDALGIEDCQCNYD